MIKHEYMNEKEVARYLTDLGIKFSPATLQKMRIKGGGIPYIKIGNRVRYLKDDIDAWIKSAPVYKSTSEESSKRYYYR